MVYYEREKVSPQPIGIGNLDSVHEYKALNIVFENNSLIIIID